MLIFSPLISCILSLALLRWLLSEGSVRWALDKPNHRSLHNAPVPRTGGLAIISSILVGWTVLSIPWFGWVAGCTLFLTLLSFFDDVRKLPVWIRFCGHFVIAAISVQAISPHFTLISIVTLLIAMVWITNLYNFMDGSDGLAGGMALFGFSAYALASWLAGDVQLALASASVASSALAFLAYNFYPSRIFMGDAGSVSLGFLAGAIGLMGWQRGLWPLWFPLMVFSPFIADATVTLLRRLFKRERVWEAHRQHYYQRLIQMGWGHRNTAIAEYILMAASSVSALLLLTKDASIIFVGFLMWIAIYFILMWIIDKRWSATQR